MPPLTHTESSRQVPDSPPYVLTIPKEHTKNRQLIDSSRGGRNRVQSWIGSGVQLNGEYIIVYADGTLRKSSKVDHIQCKPETTKGAI